MAVKGGRTSAVIDLHCFSITLHLATEGDSASCRCVNVGTNWRTYIFAVMKAVGICGSGGIVRSRAADARPFMA
jgi:hypothetical protein